jgi:transcriptional regulator with XRE-family HTH domain
MPGSNNEEMKKIEVIIERTNTGYSAYTPKYPVATTGKNLRQLKLKICEALNIYFEDKGRYVSLEDLNLTLDIGQFFEFYKVINAKAFSEQIGMNQSLLAQYIKGKKKPSANQADRILRGVRQIGRELAAIKFLL